ncbi:MAG TPA: ABC transporter permease subunit, partial [Candidatus Acidoferrales bacterium]|nr:ABC transporter permease subunit [Candidatus Acidoferrales bacterium]
MNALVKKEIRLLLPNFTVAGALTTANLFLPQKTEDLGLGALQLLLPFFFCPIMAVMLSLSSFGGEMSSGTFSLLLAQPVSRQKIWDTKVSLLALAMSILGLLWCGFAILRLRMIHHPFSILDLVSGVSVFGLAVFSGGLWAVLLLRQVAAAFWFTVLVPGLLLVILAALLDGVPDEFGAGTAVIVLGLYSLAGFFFARRLFLRAQDVQWSGGNIAMPEMRGLARFQVGSAARRVWRPRAALLLKELQLHQAQFLIAAALAVLHLGVVATRKLAHFPRNSDTEFILQGFWILWLVLPLLVGCAAVAEERKLGMHDGQLCLPVRRRTQFVVKLLVALGLSVVFGVVMPLLFEGARILPEAYSQLSIPPGWESHASTAQIVFLGCVGWFYGALPLLTLTGMAVLIGGIAFYASTVMRNLLQTLAPAVAGIAVAWFLIAVANIPWPWQQTLVLLWRGPLAYFIALPVTAATVLWLAYRNF